MTEPGIRSTMRGMTLPNTLRTASHRGFRLPVAAILFGCCATLGCGLPGQSRLVPPADQAAGPGIVRAMARAPKADPAADTALIPATRRDMQRQGLMLKRLRSVRLDVELVDMGPKEFLSYLATVVAEPAPLTRDADKKARAAHKAQRLVSAIPWMLVLGEKATKDVARFNFTGKGIDLVQLLEFYRMQTGVGTELSRGVVVLKPGEAIKPYTFLRTYNLRWAVAEVRSFPGPEIGLPSPDREVVVFDDAEEEATGTISGFTADDLEELFQTNVTPDAWGEDGISMRNVRGLFLVRHTAAGHRQMRRLLTQVGIGR